MKPSSLGLSTRLPGVLASAFLLGFLAPVVMRAQAKIEGQVLNGTTNQPVPKQEVQLLVPRQGMQQAATIPTDANGRFIFAQSEIDPGSFYLLETRFQGVSYHAPAQFDSAGTAKVNLTVYDSTRSDTALRIQSLRLLVRAQGPKVQVQEEYAVQNATRPPRAYTNAGGTFHFRLSPQVTQPTVAVTGLLNMPLAQTPEPGELPGEFSIHYPLKPGITVVTVDYEADYSSAQLALSDQVFYPVDHAEMYVYPASLSVDSEVFKPAGVDPANSIEKFESENLRRGTALEARLSGEAASSSRTETGRGEAAIKEVPNSMMRLGMPLLACFLLLLLWALGVRVAREMPRWKERRATSPAQKQLEAKVESLFNSLADLDELFASGKIAEKKYWKERLELKARLVAILKKGPASLAESYATRRIPH